MFFDDFHRKNVFRQKIFHLAIRLLYMFMHTKYHGGTPKTCSPENVSFLCDDFMDFACFGHGLDSFLKGPVIENPRKSWIFRFASVTFWYANFSKINIF